MSDLYALPDGLYLCTTNTGREVLAAKVATLFTCVDNDFYGLHIDPKTAIPFNRNTTVTQGFGNTCSCCGGSLWVKLGPTA